MNDNNGDPNNILGPFEKLKVVGNGIQEEKKINNNNNPRTVDDGSVPANYNTINVNNVLGQQSAWQCVKRPWKPTEDQLSPAQRAAKKKKEEEKKRAAELVKQRREAHRASGRVDDFIDDDEEGEPGDGDSQEEKFHYYWRLSAPRLYKGAGAVGTHWRAVQYVTDAEKKALQRERQKALQRKKKNMLNGIQEEEPMPSLQGTRPLGWVNEARWWHFCYNNASHKSIGIYTIDTDTGKFETNEKDSIYWPEEYEDQYKDLNTADLRAALVKYVNITLAENNGFQVEAQSKMTVKPTTKKPDIEEEQDNATEVDLNLSFRFKDGAFAYSAGAVEAMPTEGIYVKLRRKHVKDLEVSGGLKFAPRGDTFVLKTTIDGLAGIRLEEELTADEGVQWNSDPRPQLIEEVSSRYKSFSFLFVDISSNGGRRWYCNELTLTVTENMQVDGNEGPSEAMPDQISH